MAREDADLLGTEHRGASRFTNLWRTAHRQAWHDLKIRWRRGLFWVMCFIVPLGLCFTLLVVISLSGSASNFSLDVTACQPDGQFSLDSNDYDYWDVSGFFQVTLGFGDLTFTQAKVIDVVWDVVVGRGGQAILGLISWHVFAKYVTTTMQTRPVTFNTFRTIFMNSESLVVGVPCLIRDFSRRHGLQSKLAMVFMVATMVFILVFPTFGSAMTGYSSNVQSFVQDNESSYVPFNSFEYLYYIIHDGHRIDKWDDFRVKGREVYQDALLFSGDSLNRCAQKLTYVTRMYQDECQFIGNVTSYVSKYGLNEQKDMLSDFKGQILQSPTLKITAYYLPSNYLQSQGWTNSTTLEKELIDMGRMAWSTANQTFNMTDIKNQGSCQPTKTYKWGFSFIQLILMICLLLFWIIGIYIMYLRSYIVLRKRGSKETIGEYKAMFELTSAVQSQLDEHDGKEEASDVSVLTEDQLRRRINKDLKGGSISFKTSLLLEDNTLREEDTWSFKTWIKKEKWWLALLVLATLAMGFCVVAMPMLIVLILLPFEVLFVMYVGKSGRSRCVLLLWPVLVFGVVPTSILSTLMQVRSM